MNFVPSCLCKSELVPRSTKGLFQFARKGLASTYHRHISISFTFHQHLQEKHFIILILRTQGLKCLLQKTVFITGCSDGGIGSGLAIALQKRGFHVFASARNFAKMDDLAHLENFTLLQLDVTDKKRLATAVQIVKTKTNGSLDHLISNVGRTHFMPILDEYIEDVKELFEVNLFGPMALVKAFTPLLIKAKGHVTFITSISGYINVPYMGESRQFLCVELLKR